MQVFGEEVAEFVRGESVLSAKSAQLLLSAVRSGILADTNLLSGNTAKNAIENIGSLLSSISSEGTGSSTRFEEKLKEAISELDDSERKRLDYITEEIVQQSISSATDRLSGVPRVL